MFKDIVIKNLGKS